MTAFESDERVTEFRDRLTGRARRNLNSAGMVAHAHLIKAFNAGHTPKAIADACNRDLPSSDRTAYTVLQSRIEWFANNPPGSQERPPAPTTRSEAGCQHTEDPNGWITDSDGVITGKCPCWSVSA